MSKKASPMMVGSFVLGAIVSAIGAILYVGSLSFSTGNPQFVVFFDESVAGLEEGAKVKYRGIGVGAVKTISLRLPNQDSDSTHIPVVIELNLEVLRRLGGRVDDEEISFDDHMIELVDRGLRAQMQLGSILTGQSYIELDLHEGVDPPVFVQPPDNRLYPEIPSISSPFAELGQSTSDVVAKIATLPFDELSEQLVSLIEGINVLIADAKEHNVTAALVQALEAFRDRMADPKIDASIASLNRTLDQMRKSMASANSEFGPIAEDIHGMADDVEATLVAIRAGFNQVKQAGKEVEVMLKPESSFRYRLEEVLVELAAASSALRELAEQLERSPSSLITGKAGAAE